MLRGSTADGGVRRVRRLPRKPVVVLVLGYWAFWIAGIILQSLFRGLGDEFFEPTNLRSVEAQLFGGVPTEFLQEQFRTNWHSVLFWFGYGNHAVWFFVPQFMALTLTLTRRDRLGEFFAWIIVSTLLAGCVFLVFPVVPPWMDGNSERVLLEGLPSDFVNVDNNPVAAFPSMHAGVPALMGLFFWIRCREDGRPLAWLCFGYAATVGFSVVYLGEHWVLDVVAGYAIAGVVAWAFVSGWVRRATRAIPGDPIDWVIRTNERLLAPVPEAAPAQEPERAPAESEPVRRAA